MAGGSRAGHVMSLRFLRVPETFTSFFRGFAEFFVFLPFHTTVLKPDLDLPLRKTKCLGDLAPSRTAQIFVEVKLFLQL